MSELRIGLGPNARLYAERRLPDGEVELALTVGDDQLLLILEPDGQFRCIHQTYVFGGSAVIPRGRFVGKLGEGLEGEGS